MTFIVCHIVCLKEKAKRPPYIRYVMSYSVPETIEGRQRRLQVQREEQMGKRPHHICPRLINLVLDIFFCFRFPFFFFVLIFTHIWQAWQESGTASEASISKHTNHFLLKIASKFCRWKNSMAKWWQFCYCNRSSCKKTSSKSLTWKLLKHDNCAAPVQGGRRGIQVQREEQVGHGLHNVSTWLEKN